MIHRARTVLVTGAGRPGGIGAAIASAMAAGGDRVCVHFRTDLDAASRVLESLAPSEAGPHVCLPAALEKEGAPASLVHRALQRLGGRLDVLVCNHGVYEETPIATTSEAAWSDSFRRLLRVNLAAPAELAHAFGKAAMAREGGGSIIFVSSRGALRGEPLAPAYGASKAGLNALTGSLAQALGPHGVRVAGVAPGFVATAMAEPVLSSDRGDSIRAQSPWGRVGTPEEVAEAVRFLASDGATWCTGAVVDCNGASYLH